MFWKTGVSLEATKALFTVMDELLADHDQVAVLVTVYDGIELPQRDAQAVISDGLKARTPNLDHGVAIAIEGSGLGATLGRSIARTISLFSRQGYPSKVFPSASDGLAWLRSNGAASGADDETFQGVRAQVDTRSA